MPITIIPGIARDTDPTQLSVDDQWSWGVDYQSPTYPYPSSAMGTRNGYTALAQAISDAIYHIKYYTDLGYRIDSAYITRDCPVCKAEGKEPKNARQKRNPLLQRKPCKACKGGGVHSSWLVGLPEVAA